MWLTCMVLLGVVLQIVRAAGYRVEVVDLPNQPLLSHFGNTSAYWAAFNPTYIPANKAKGQEEGLLVRVQDCALEAGYCAKCGYRQSPSKLAFSSMHRTG